MKRKTYSFFRFPLVFLIIFSVLIFSNSACRAQEKTLPAGFVYVETVIPDIKVELRYYSTHNLIGGRIDGYLAPRCILTQRAAEALKKVQAELKPFGLGLKIYDAYRPQQAVDHLIRWAADRSDVRMKAEFYPKLDKKDLFGKGYFARRSGHSRGSAVDLTLVPLDAKNPDDVIDMGSPYDFLDPISRPDSSLITPEQRSHRMLLQALMKKHGFRPHAYEWWHFRLEDEPFPNTYFNFPVQ